MKAYREVKSLSEEFIDESLGYFINPKNRFMNSLLIESGLPGGMMGSLMSDLEKTLFSLNKWLTKNKKKTLNINMLFSLLLDEVKSIWSLMGNPPLVTPYSQYVKNVALGNVVQEMKGKNRWSLIDDNTWDMLLGKSGKLPGEVDHEIKLLAKKLNKEFYIDDPQNLYPNKISEAKKEMNEKGWSFGEDNEELLEYALHKTQYLDFKSGKAKETFNIILEKNKNPIQEESNISDQKEIKHTIIEVDSEKFKVEYIIEATTNNKKKKLLEGKNVLSPLEGKFYLTKDSSENGVSIGDKINKGNTICYIESMKVINAIKAEYSGKILQICFNNGEEVYDDDVLFILE